MNVAYDVNDSGASAATMFDATAHAFALVRNGRLIDARSASATATFAAPVFDDDDDSDGVRS